MHFCSLHLSLHPSHTRTTPAPNQNMYPRVHTHILKKISSHTVQKWPRGTQAMAAAHVGPLCTVCGHLCVCMYVCVCMCVCVYLYACGGMYISICEWGAADHGGGACFRAFSARKAAWMRARLADVGRLVSGDVCLRSLCIPLRPERCKADM